MVISTYVLNMYFVKMVRGAITNCELNKCGTLT